MHTWNIDVKIIEGSRELMLVELILFGVDVVRCENNPDVIHIINVEKDHVNAVVLRLAALIENYRFEVLVAVIPPTDLEPMATHQGTRTVH